MTIRFPEARNDHEIELAAVIGRRADRVSRAEALLEMELKVNGETRRKAPTSALLRDLATLIERASAFYTLMPGDLLHTGTPEGVVRVVAGDRIHAAISGIGRMEIAVR